MAGISKPIEKLVLDAARSSGCTDEAAAIQVLQVAGQNGGRFIDALLDAGLLPDEAVFFRRSVSRCSFRSSPFRNRIHKIRRIRDSPRVLPCGTAY
jgi:hypothetical protein